MAMNKDGLKAELLTAFQPIIDAATSSDPDAPPKSIQEQFTSLATAIADSIVDHIVTNMEISGVQSNINTPAQTVETFVLGVGTNGSSLLAAGAPGAPLISGNIKHGLTDRMNSTQTNDGTGLVT